jgi:hypothetical protein
MKKCFKQLNGLAEMEPSMTKAVENIKKDCRSADQPNGNIPVAISKAMSGICSKYPENQTGHLEETVKNHQSINKPKFYTPVSPPQDEPLRRAISLSSFIAFHILESHRGKTLIGKSSAKHSSFPYLKKALLDEFEDNRVELEFDRLQGTTGKQGEATWWTFYEKGGDMPKIGEKYMQELALGEDEMKKAEKDKIVVELAINAETLGKELFKPTALDSFIPETKFEPELTGRPYGYTAPEESGLQSRPELVSASVRYSDMNKNMILTLKKIPYLIQQ